MQKTIRELIRYELCFVLLRAISWIVEHLTKEPDPRITRNSTKTTLWLRGSDLNDASIAEWTTQTHL